MASVEISFLTGFKSLIVIYFPPFLHCIFSPLCNCRDIVVVLIRRIIIVESLPELLHAVAASASIWGAGSLQVLELTPASPVSTSTRWPPSLRSAVLRNPRVYFTGPPSMTPSQRLLDSCSFWFEWTHPRSAWGAHSTSPRVPYKGLNPTYWSFLSLVLAWSPSGGPSSLPVNSLRTWSQKLTSLISLVVLCGTETFHRLPQSHFNKCKP